MNKSIRLTCLLLLGLACWAGPAFAHERAFAYTQQSMVLSPGDSELEAWNTFRVGREHYFSRLDSRVELEHGVAPGLQLALYWNFETISMDVRDPLTQKLERVTESQLASASLELKYQLSDPVADALGSAAYFEVSVGPSESELEGKLILDKKLGKWLLAGNVIAEYELEFVRGDEGSEAEKSFELQLTLAAAYAVGGGVNLGLELRAPLGLSGEAESSSLFGGPVLSWAGPGAWAALGVQPQLTAFSGASAGGKLDLEHRERLEVRLLAGFIL